MLLLSVGVRSKEHNYDDDLRVLLLLVLSCCCWFIKAYDNGELTEEDGGNAIRHNEEYNGFKLAREMLEFNLSDRKGKPRRYTKGYIVFALSLRTTLGKCKYEKVRRLNFLPLLCRKTLDGYLRNQPVTTHPKKIDKETKRAFHEVC